MKKLNTRTPVFFHVGLVLLCLVLCSTYMTGGLYARYTASAQGSDSARVAIFKITSEGIWEDSQEANVLLSFFDQTKLSDSLTIKVSSESEVSVKCDVIVTMPEGMANYDWLGLTLNGASPTSMSDNVFTFSNVDTFAPNSSEEREYTLTFSVKKEYWGNPDNIQDVKNGKVFITVRAEQID